MSRTRLRRLRWSYWKRKSVSDIMTCPHCGVRFNNTETDDRAFIEEEDFEDWMDEEDGI